MAKFVPSMSLKPIPPWDLVLEIFFPTENPLCEQFTSEPAASEMNSLSPLLPSLPSFLQIPLSPPSDSTAGIIWFRSSTSRIKFGVNCSQEPIRVLKTCRNCKTQFDPDQNHPCACRFHTAHFGGETKRKFESVYTGGTMSTPNSGQVLQYWHCCGSEDPFDPGCTMAPHSSYDD